MTAAAAPPTTIRLNLGCGDYRIPEFVGIDMVETSATDVVMTVPPLPYKHNVVEEIYCGHFLEHLDRDTGAELIRECYRVLRPGGTLGVVVPDFHEVADRYLHDLTPALFQWADGFHDLHDLDELNHFILFSTCQPSHHLWMYDLHTLRRLLERSGFVVEYEIDRIHDPRLSTARWYQCGLQVRKPG